MKEKELYTVLVADDEEELCQAVCRLIPWEELGFRLLGGAGNGLDALQLVEQLQPDLLLTDIQMPFISGTSLARQVRELQPLIQVAFLSGYDDFEYAQAAIDSQVIAYLLKPISMEDLAAALRDIHAKMEEKFQYLYAAGSGEGELPLAVASLLLDSFAELPEEEALHAALSELGLVVTAPYRLVVLASHIRGQTGQAAAQTVDKVLRRTYSCCSLRSGSRVLTLVVSEDRFQRLGPALDELLQVLRRLLDPACTIGVSRQFDRFDQCHAACREAVDAQRFSAGDGIRHFGNTPTTERARYRAPEESSAELERLMHGPGRAPLERYLSAALDGAGGDMEILQLIVMARGILCASLDAAEVDLLFERCGLLSPFSAGLDTDALRRRTWDLCLSGYELLARKKQGGVGQLCAQAIRMIEQSYMDEGLSLQSVSEQLHVSPNYLSANMKKYAGDTFINLLIKKRMEAALSLIRAENVKIADVARLCGYGDQHYFSFCFKKYYGISPGKMRRGGKEEAGGETP